MWPWSRIRELESANANLNRRLEDWEEIFNRKIDSIDLVQDGIQTQLSALSSGLGQDIDDLRVTLSTLSSGLSRVITKLDAKFAESEFDPARKAESDKLAEEAIKRLRAEALARAPYK